MNFAAAVMLESSVRKTAAGSPLIKKNFLFAKKKLVNIQTAAYRSLRMVAWKSMGIGKVQTVDTNLVLSLFTIATPDSFCCLFPRENWSVTEGFGKEAFQPVSHPSPSLYLDDPIVLAQPPFPMGTISLTPTQTHHWLYPFPREVSTREEPSPDTTVKRDTF